MRQKFVLILGVMTLILGVLAFWLSAGRQAERETAQTQRLFPDLQAQLNQLTKVRVSDSATDESVTLVKKDDRWEVQERAGYTANIPDLRLKLLTLAQSELTEKKTANSENHSRLGVETPDADDAQSALLELFEGENKTELIIGKRKQGGQAGTYVRKPEDQQSWLASGDLKWDADPKSWLIKNVINIEDDRLSRVVITHADNERVEVFKTDPAQDNFLLADLPESRELLSPTSADTLATVLSNMTLDDVSADADFSGGTPMLEAVYESFDGLRITIQAWELDNQYYLRLDPKFDAALVRQPVATTSTDSETSKPASSDLPSAEAVQKEIDEIKGIVDHWVFQIPSYKFNNLNKRIEDLLKPEAEATQSGS